VAELNTGKRWGLKIAVLVVGLIVAVMHVFYVRSIFISSMVGGYFLVATVLFAVGAIASVTSGRIRKVALYGLLALSIIDCGLIYATRTFSTPLFGGRILSWSMNWVPPGVVQVFIAQVVLIGLAGYALTSK